MNKLKIRSFLFEENSADSSKDSSTTTSTPKLLNLCLTRKGALYILIHSKPTSTSTPKERQFSIINSINNKKNPFPSLSLNNNKIRIWLKIGSHSKGESIVGGENWLLLEKLLNPPLNNEGEEGFDKAIIKDTGIKIEIGLNSYPLVEILLEESELAKSCESCGDFESCEEGIERYKRCNRCKQAYYCSAICQSKDWKLNHKSQCYDEPNDDFKSLEESRRKNLFKLYGLTETLEGDEIEDTTNTSTRGRSKMD